MTTTTKFVPATDAQKSFVKALREGRELPADVAAYYSDEFINEKMTKVQAHRAIDGMKLYPFKPNTKAEVQHAEKADPVTEEGIYEKNGEVFDVIKSGRGFFYAKTLTDNGFVYAGARPVKALSPADKMTKVRAQELSLQRSRCIRCGKQLSKASSVAQGMGDICMSHFA